MMMTRRGKRRLLALIALVAFTCGTVFVVSSVRAAQERKLVAAARSAGLSAYRSGDLDAALKQLSFVFEHDKNDFEVNFAFAEARARRPIAGGRHLVEAVDLFSNHCLPLLNTPKSPTLEMVGSQQRDIHLRLLDLYSQMGLRFEIIRTADALLKEDPDCVRALGAKTEALWLERDFAAATPLAERLVELEPDRLEHRRMLLEIQRELGVSAEQRLELCRQWAGAHVATPGDGRFHVLLAAMLLDLDRVDEARHELATAADRGAADPEVLERTAELLDLLDQRDQSDALMAATIRQYPLAAWPREIAARRLWHAHRLDEALALLEQSRRDLPEQHAVLLQLQVLTLISARQVDEAKRLLAEIVRDATTGNSNPNMGHVADERRDLMEWTAAVAAAIDPKASWRDRAEGLDRAIALSPQDAALHSLMGDLWMEIGEQSRAVQSYQHAMALGPDWLAASMAYVDALRRSGRLEEAYRAGRIAISRAPKTQIEPLLLFARIYLELRETGRIMESPESDEDVGRDLLDLLTQLRREPLHPEHAVEVAALLTEGLFQIDGEPAAVEFINSCLEPPTPAGADLFLALAEISLRHDLATFEPALQAARDADGLTVPVALGLAESLARQNDPAAGLNLIDEAMANNAGADQDPSAAMARARYMARHDMPGAIAAWHDLLSQHADSIEIPQHILSDPAMWSEGEPRRALIVRAIDNLKRTLGGHSSQVMLAEASLWIRDIDDGAWREKDVARVIRQIESVLQRTPDSLAALSLMAEAAMLIDPPNAAAIDRAIAYLEHAAALYPGESAVLVRLVALLQQHGDYTKAGRYLHAMAAMGARRPPLQRAELRLWNAQPDFETALARAAALVDQSSPPSDQLILAAMLQRAGKDDEAETIYERLLTISPDDALTLVQAAEFFALTGRFERGLGLIQQVAARNRGGAASHPDVFIGAFYQRHGQLEKAAEHLTRAVAQEPNSVEARRELARHLLALNRHDAAAEQAMAGLQLDAGDLSLQSILTLACLGLNSVDRGKLAPAVARLNDGSDPPKTSSVNLEPLIATTALLADVRQINGKNAATPDQLAAARHLVDESTPTGASCFLPAWQAAIQLHVDADRLNEAIELARSAVSRFPAAVEPAQWAAQLLMADSSPGSAPDALAEAEEWRRRSILAAADPIEADVAIASIMLKMNRGADALAQINRYSDRLWNERHRHPGRLETWLHAQVASDSTWLQSPIAQERLATLFRDDSRWRQAWVVLSQKLDPDAALAALNLLEAQTRDGRELLALAAEWTMLGKAGGSAECFAHARGCAQRAGEQAGMEVAALIAQGAIAESERNWSEAESLYRRALDLNPDEAIAANNLAYLLAQNPDRCTEALPLIEHALTILPDQPDLLDTQARVLLAMNRADHAVRVLQHAAQLRPDDLAIALSLAEARLSRNQADNIAESLVDLQHRLRLERRVDPELQSRLDQLWERFRQSREQPAT